MWKFLNEMIDILLQMSTHTPMAGNPKHPVAGSGDGISYHHCNTGEGELGAAPHNTGIQVLEWWLCLLWLSDRTRETRDSPAHTLQTWGGPRPGSCCSASGPPSPSVGYSPLLEQWPLWFFNLEINTVIIPKILAPTSVFLLTDSALTQNYVFSTLKLGDLV